jgi:hypothetical protein
VTESSADGGSVGGGEMRILRTTMVRRRASGSEERPERRARPWDNDGLRLRLEGKTLPNNLVERELQALIAARGSAPRRRFLLAS